MKKLVVLLMVLVLVVGMSSIAMAATCSYASWLHANPTAYLGMINDKEFAPTCVDEGKIEYYCINKDCGEVVYTKILPAAGHKVENGKCTVCEKIVCPACESTSVHTNKKSYVAPTCNTDGKQDYDCLKCKTEWQVTFPKLGGAHSWIEYPELSVPSTCVERGLKGEQCKKCGYTRTIDALLNPKNHAHIKTVPEVPATCNATGLEAYEMCADCETKITEPNVIPKSTEHSDVITHTKKATCSAEGSITTYCDLCEEVLSTEVLPKLKHTFVDGACTVCGEPCDGWFHNSWAQTDEYKNRFNKDTLEATCSTTGMIWYKCVNCGGRVFSEEIPELDHTPGEVVTTKHPNCTERGEWVQYCKECGEPFKSGSTATKPDAHDVKVVTVKHPTCTERGEWQKRCVREGCDYVEQSGTTPPKANAHDLYDVEEKAKTCTEDGYTAHKACKNCSYTEGKEIFVAEDHTLSFWYEKDECKHWQNCVIIGCNAKNLEEAEHTYVDGKCVCGAEEPKEPEHEHVLSFWYEKDECKHWKNCTIIGCNAKNLEEAEHTYVDGKCVCGAEEPKHEHTLSFWYEKDETKHWKNCTIIGCNAKNLEEAEHTYVDGKCVCGAEEPEEDFKPNKPNRPNKPDHNKPNRPDHNKPENNRPGHHGKPDNRPNRPVRECNHKWVKVSVEAATCTEAGLKTSKCVKCDEVKEETIAATGHKRVKELPGKAATCTKPGYTKSEICLACKTTITKGEKIPATGHKFDKLEKVNDKVHKVSCSVCDKPESKRPVAHVFVDKTEGNVTTHTCECGYSYADAVELIKPVKPEVNEPEEKLEEDKKQETEKTERPVKRPNGNRGNRGDRRH